MRKSMILIRRLLLTLFILIVVTADCPGFDTDSTVDEDETLILYNGSVRGFLGKLTGGVQPQTLALIHRLRKKHKNLFLLAAGDMMGPGLTGDVDKGALVIKTMNRCGYDAVGVGPHDFFAGADEFAKRVGEAKFPYVCANLSMADGNSTSVKPWIRCTKAGKSIFVTGAMSQKIVRQWPKWSKDIRISDARKSIESLKRFVHKGELVVVLSSMNWEENIRLLKALPWVHIIIGTIVTGNQLIDLVLRDLTLVDGRRIMWTAYAGKALGLLRASFKGNELVSAIRRFPIKATDNDEVDEEIAAKVRSFEKRVAELSGACITRLTTAEREDFTTAILQAARYEQHAEIAFIDSSSIRIKKGPECLTRGILRRAYPFQSRLALAKVPGRRLLELWKRRNDDVVWGEGLSFVGMSERGGRVFVNGRMLRTEDIYRVATTEYLALGGRDLIKQQNTAIEHRTFVEALVDHFSRFDADQRRKRYIHLEHRTITRHSYSLTVAYDDLSFEGKADEYQYDDPNAFGKGSDIPGLVGKPHDSFRIGLNAETVFDRPDSDLTMRLDIVYTTWNESRSIDHGEFTIRREGESFGSHPHWFSEMNLSGTVRAPDLEGREHPLFAIATTGLAWKLSGNSKLLGGLGHLVRFSQKGDPGATGLNLQYEFKKPVAKDIECSGDIDVFGSLDGEDVRMMDATLALKFRMASQITTELRYRRFIWADDDVDAPAFRNEFYIGIGIGRVLRRF